MSLQELKLDLEEFKRLSGLTTRERVREILSLEIRKLQTSVASLEEKQAPPKDEPEPTNSPSAVSQPAATRSYTVTVENYAWDQSDKFMKIYVTAEGVSKIPAEKVSCDFTQKSFDLLVRDLNGKNYKLRINNLMHDIVPESSKYKIKTDSVLIMLKKAEEGKTWPYVVKQDNKSSVPKFDENKDPQEGLMDMMRKMYDDGDDEMKRTIAKAWTESRDKNPGMF